MTTDWKEALAGFGHARAADLIWALTPKDDPGAERAIGAEHPARVAHAAVQEALAPLRFPFGWTARYQGVKRTAGTGPFGVTDGVINMDVEFRTHLGARCHLQVPVFVRAGRALRPSVFIHEGHTSVITQTALDDILGAYTLTKPILDRQMFSPPVEDRGRPAREVITYPDMFKSSARKPGDDAEAGDGHGVAPAPRSWGRGAELKLKREVECPQDGGVLYRLSKGMKVKVRRQLNHPMEDMWLVFVPDMHMSFRVPGDALG